MFFLFATVVFWVATAGEEWGCWRREKCNTVDDWIGAVGTFAMLLFFGISLRIGIVIVFALAVFRINDLVTDLKKYGFVSSTKILRIHVAVSVFDLIGNFVIGVWTFAEAFEALENSAEKGSADY